MVTMDHTHTETDLDIENQYPKLVRDKIPEMIERDGRTAITHVAGQEEYLRYLLSKLIEEATELKHAVGSDHQKEELADVRQVLADLQVALNFSDDEIDKVQASKFAERGGFAERIILDALPE
jgi:predicted house-cleaning noncanonical NTP pyrophosphatase (MazG superfamily)